MWYETCLHNTYKIRKTFRYCFLSCFIGIFWYCGYVKNYTRIIIFNWKFHNISWRYNDKEYSECHGMHSVTFYNKLAFKPPGAYTVHVFILEQISIKYPCLLTFLSDHNLLLLSTTINEMISTLIIICMKHLRWHYSYLPILDWFNFVPMPCQN